MKKFFYLSVMLLCAAFAFVSCSDDEDPIAVASITLNEDDLSLEIGATTQLKATILPENATDQRVHWSSSDANVATVVDGLVTAVAEGTTTIRATSGTMFDECVVTVKPKSLFVLSVSDIQWDSFVFSIQCLDKNMNFVYGIKDKKSVEKWANGGTDDDFYQYEVDWAEFVGSMDSRTWQDVMRESFTKGAIEANTGSIASAFTYDTEYVLYAFGVNDNCERITPVEKLELRTLGPTPVDMTFDIKVDALTPHSVKATITPSKEGEPYYVNVQSSKFVKFYVEKDMLDVMMEKLVLSSMPQNTNPNNWVDAGGQWVLDPETVQLKSGTTYYIVVFGFNNGPTTKPTLFEFTTPKAS